MFARGLRLFLYRPVIHRNSSTKTDLKKTQTWTQVKQLLRLAKPERKYIAGAVGLIAVSSAVSMSLPSVIGTLIDHASTPDAPIYGLTRNQFLLALGSVFVVGAIANSGRIIILKITGEKLVARLRTKTMKSMLSQDATFLDKHRVGDLISRLSSDASIVSKSVTSNLSDGCRATLQGVVGIGMMTYISLKLTTVMTMMVPPLGILAMLYGGKIKKISRQLQDKVGQLSKTSEEQLNSLKTVQAYAGERKELQRYSNEVRSVFNIGVKEAVASALFFGSTGLIGNIAMIGLLLVGTADSSITLGELSSFMMYGVYTGSSVFGLTGFYSELMKGCGAAERVLELQNMKTKISPTKGISPPKTLKGLPITFNNVSFAYSNGKSVLSEMNFQIHPGEHVCFVGGSGCGKSTISSLLLRYYRTGSGNISIGNYDISAFNLRKYRRMLGVVQQEPLLFNGTILDNITYGLHDKSLTDLNMALKAANCDQFIKESHMGLDTLVGPRGAQLSGGQRQRIALARVFLQNPDILILDEATSALDTKSEDIINKELQRRQEAGMTTISIAHRLSTIRHSSRVIVIEDGRVVESGSFDQLRSTRDSELNKLLKEGLEHHK